MAKIDIIMPLYNKANTVLRAVESIQKQTEADWRLIVVNDGSTDGGENLVRRQNDGRIEMINQDNRGPGAARNAGIRQTNAKYTAFLDADDQWYPWYLQNSLNAIENNPVAMVCSMYHEWPMQTDMTSVWAKRKIFPGTYELKGTESPAWADFLLCFAHVGNSVLTTETTKKYDGFYEGKKCTYGEDAVFFVRIGFNERFMIIAPPAVRHHREDSGLSNKRHKLLVPFFEEPEIIAGYCPDSKKDFVISVISHMALRTAIEKARYGLKNEALELVNKIPGAKSFKWQHRRFRLIASISPLYKYWVRFKCSIGAPVRKYLRILARKIGLISNQ